jgi:tetratricopeptide (TPR) repeat protein
MTPLLELNNAMSKPENQTRPELALQLVTPAKLTELSTALSAVVDYEKTSGKKIYTKDIEETVQGLSPMLLNYAVGLGTAKKHKEASSVLYSMYQLDKSKPDNLYYAASYAVNGGDFDVALKYYDELKALKYSGEGTIYYATNTLSGVEEQFKSKADRDKFVTLKSHTKPREEKIPSKRGEIYKNVALILVQKGNIEGAKSAFAEAKRENPTDISLMINEADFYATQKDYTTYKKLVNEILAKNPNDATLVYNLGVVSLESGNLTEAETYFNRALEIDPKYGNAYLNMSALKLKADEKIVEEMNNLGTSAKENKRYEELKSQRQTLFQAALPYLEKAYAIDPANETVITNLLSVYNFLEMTDKYKALKAKR